MGCVILSGTRIENLRHMCYWLFLCGYVCAHSCMRVLYILTIFLIPRTLNMSVIHFVDIVSNDGLDFGYPD